MAIDRRATRLGALALVAVLLVGALGARLWFLQGTQAEEYQEAVSRAKTRTVVIAGERGRILDADGRILADNRRVLVVAVDWAMLNSSKNRNPLFSRLSGALGVPLPELHQRYNPCYPAKSLNECDTANPYDRRLPMPLVEGVDEQQVSYILERIEDYPGVVIEQTWERVYPYGSIAAHVVGYMGAITAETKDEYRARGYTLNERVGQFGVELSMEQFLHGTWGTRVFEINASGAIVRELVDQGTAPTAGFDIQLSIDLDLQLYAEQALETQLRNRRSLPPTSEPGSGVEAQPKNAEFENPLSGELELLDPTLPEGPVPYKAPAGSMVVMDHETGEILAMASYPTFDPRWFTVDLSGGKFEQVFPTVLLPNGKADPDFSVFTNRAVQGQYNLGSTIKPFMAWASMHSGLITANDVWNDFEGTYTLRSISEDRCDTVRCEFRNARDGTGRPSRYGSVRVEESLAVSSDTFYYRLGDEFYLQGRGDELKADLEQFGFGSETGVLLPFEWPGRVPDDEIKADLVERGVLLEGEVPTMQPGDYIQVSIGQGLMAATPLQITNAYATLGNGGQLLRPVIVSRILEPFTPDDPTRPGYADLTKAVVFESYVDEPEVRLTLDMPPEIYDPIVRGLQRVITGPGVYYPSNFYRSPTGEKLFKTYNYDALPLAGKTGTAQGFKSLPWNDSSAFVGFSLDPSQPYTIGVYLEKAGFGARGAAPIAKCVFNVLHGATVPEPVSVAEPLDEDLLIPAPSRTLADQRCLGGVDTSVGRG